MSFSDLKELTVDDVQAKVAEQSRKETFSRLPEKIMCLNYNLEVKQLKERRKWVGEKKYVPPKDYELECVIKELFVCKLLIKYF